MKNININKMLKIKAGYSLWDCFSTPILLLIWDGNPVNMGAYVGYDLALIKYCWDH